MKASQVKQGWSLRRMDRAVIRTVKNHTHLMYLLFALCVILWGIMTKHTAFVFEMVGVGAVAYYFGASLSLLAAVILTAVSVHSNQGFNLAVTVTWMELGGYLLVIRLGLGHREEQALLRRQLRQAPPRQGQMMPWHVTNDMRTSLAAVRFLLFPVQTDQNRETLEQAVAELKRLEQIFQAMEDNKLKTSDDDIEE